MEYKKVDFPEPTLPTTPTKLPLSIFKSFILNAISYFFPDEILC